MSGDYSSQYLNGLLRDDPERNLNWPFLDKETTEEILALYKKIQPQDNAYASNNHPWRLMVDLRVIVEAVDPDRGAWSDSQPDDLKLLSLLWNNGKALATLAHILATVPVEELIAMTSKNK